METMMPAQSAEGGSQQDDNDRDQRGVPRKSKKRTKTGCITCRKRRIKCDEQKPECKNCNKSRRFCEGYQQAFQFKPPLEQRLWNDGRPGLMAIPIPPHIRSGDQPQMTRGSHTLPGGPFNYQQQPRSSHQGGLALLAPRPYDIAWHLQGSSVAGTTFGPHRVVPDPAPRHDPESMRMPLANPLAQVPMSNMSPQTPCFNEGIPHRPIYGTEDGTSYLHAPWVNNGLGQLPGSEQGPDRDTSGIDGIVDPGMEETFEDGTESSWRAPTYAADASQQRAHGVGVQPAPNDVRTLVSRAWFAHADLLDSQELRDTYTHFLRVTGPLLSLYERHPYSTSFEDRSSATFSWNYTMPEHALRHPVLLHAMLALSGLQQAKLQDMPIEPCLKQYHYSVNRLRENLKSTFHQGLIPVLAANLLLGYFEVWMSKHNSWCRHLLGTSLILQSLPLQDMAQTYLPAKRQRIWAGFAAGMLSPNEYGGAHVLPDEYNYQLLSTILGYVVTPEEYGLGSTQSIEHLGESASDADIERYESLRDLVWWYNKLDVYQAILGGSKLLRNWNLWIQCPPRAGHNLRSAVYGAYDHVILILARLADFASRDLPRKRKAAKASAGATGPTSSPQFPGIVPTGPNVTAPRGFSASRHESPQTVSNEETDSRMSFNEAVLEWESIERAFQLLKSELQEAFAELPAELSDARPTPFGKPLQYNSFDVAGLWMNYYMGMIQLHRCHPRMPPAAMPAAHLADANTRLYANLIGRVAAGLSPDIPPDRIRVDVTMGAAFLESSFCLFVAGIQLKDAAQRSWVIQRMTDIVRLIGWQSGTQIAAALEGGWIKMHQLGRGPEYKRFGTNHNVEPQTLRDNPRRLDRQMAGIEAANEQTLPNADRANLAMGLIAIEEDLQVLDLQGD